MMQASLPGGLVADPRFPGAGIHPTSIVDAGATIGRGTFVWHFCHILTGTEIGEDASIGQNCMIGPKVRVGNRCKIQNNVSLYEGVTLDDDVFCGPSCVFTNVRNPRAHVSRKAEFATTHVGRGATIGANATIVCGHDIGAYALIGAGAVVTRTVPAHAVMLGNPARQPKTRAWVSRAGEVLGDDLVCPRTHERYRLTTAGTLELAPA